MATCTSNGVTWSRHKYRKSDGLCKRCGVNQTVMHRALQNRRAKRKAERVAKKQVALAKAGQAQL